MSLYFLKIIERSKVALLNAVTLISKLKGVSLHRYRMRSPQYQNYIVPKWASLERDMNLLAVSELLSGIQAFVVNWISKASAA